MFLRCGCWLHLMMQRCWYLLQRGLALPVGQVSLARRTLDAMHRPVYPVIAKSPSECLSARCGFALRSSHVLVHQDGQIQAVFH